MFAVSFAWPFPFLRQVHSFKFTSHFFLGQDQFWWWDHIDSTPRYRLWHPIDHVSFRWIVPLTTSGHVGAVQEIQEFFNGFPEHPLRVRIRWEDSAEARAEYGHVLLATGVDEAGLRAILMHEYEEMEGGMRMRSHFLLDRDTSEFAVRALYLHNKQEMGNLPKFLPQLYSAEVELPKVRETSRKGESS